MSIRRYFKPPWRRNAAVVSGGARRAGL